LRLRDHNPVPFSWFKAGNLVPEVISDLESFIEEKKARPDLMLGKGGKNKERNWIALRVRQIVANICPSPDTHPGFSLFATATSAKHHQCIADLINAAYPEFDELTADTVRKLKPKNPRHG
jgi:hypothetical protein